MKNTFALIAVALLGLAGPSLAQDIPVYDPNYIPMDLRLTRVDPCKVMVPADPVWPAAKINKTDSSGDRVRGVEYTLDSAFWERQPDKAQQYVVNPLLIVTVSCNPTTLTETGSLDGLAFFLPRATMARSKSAPATRPGSWRSFRPKGWARFTRSMKSTS